MQPQQQQEVRVQLASRQMLLLPQQQDCQLCLAHVAFLLLLLLRVMSH
jgi:hypothetical protein